MGNRQIQVERKLEPTKCLKIYQLSKFHLSILQTIYDDSNLDTPQSKVPKIIFENDIS